MIHSRLIWKNLIGNIDLVSFIVRDWIYIFTKVSKAAEYYLLLFRQTIITYTIILKNSSTEFCNDFEEYLNGHFWAVFLYKSVVCQTLFRNILSISNKVYG